MDKLEIIFLTLLLSFCLFNSIYFLKLLNEYIENPDSTTISNPKATYIFVIILNMLAFFFFIYIFYNDIVHQNEKIDKPSLLIKIEEKPSPKYFKGIYS